MLYFQRTLIPQIQKWLYKEMVIILYGARQVGKTTIAKELAKDYADNIFINCEEPEIQELFSGGNVNGLKSYIGQSKFVILDEAQKISDIGILLKLMVDKYPEVQIIATGSSSFDLANKITEPLTGRNIKFTVFPLSLTELASNYTKSEITGKLDDLMIYGSYPRIVTMERALTIDLLTTLAGDYLYRDLLIYDNLRKSDLLKKLLKYLAFRIGSELSIGGLAKELGVDSKTINTYLDLLEQSFIVFRIGSFSRNLDKEIKSKIKVYFYDLGIRNSIIGAYQNSDTRIDMGNLWENFAILERLKYHQKLGRRVNLAGGADIGGQVNFYFWKLQSNFAGEVDLIEEYNGQLEAYEIKYSTKLNVNTKTAKIFVEEYSKKYPLKFEIIAKNLWWESLV